MHAALFVPVFAAAAFAQSSGSIASAASSAGSAASSAASAAVSSFTGDAFPQTSFLQQTNSLGVVTGQPAVDTSIATQPGAVTTEPAAVTTQPPVESVPALGPGIHSVIQGIPGTNSTRTFVVSYGSTGQYSIVTPTPSSSSGASGSAGTTGGSQATNSDGTPVTTGTAAGAKSTGAAPAATMGAVAGSMLGLGAFVAALL